MKKTLLVSIDLEMNQPSGKIIQIGAAIGDCVSGEIFDMFSRVVNPQEALAESIVKLTGITQEQVDAAPLLPDAYDMLLAWLESFSRQRVLNPVVWGGDDMICLRTELGIEELPRTSAQESDGARIVPHAGSAREGAAFSKPARRWVFGHRWLDAKTVFAAWALARGENPRSGLQRSMQRLGMAFDGVPHDAGIDALNTFRIWHALGQRFQR